MPRPIGAELHIKVNGQGELEVNAPFHDRGLCYALLEEARDVVKAMCDNLEKRKVLLQVGPEAVPADLRRVS